MNWPDRLNGVALIASLVIHLIFFSIFSRPIDIHVIEKKEQMEVPVSMEIVQVVPPKKKPTPAKRLPKPVPPKKTGARSPKQKFSSPTVVKNAAPVAKKPAPFPGDRARPEVVTHPNPIYPKAALNNDWTGTVEIEFLVNAQGKATFRRLIQSTGHEVLDATFIRTVEHHYRFKPRRHLGKNVAGKVRLRYEFR